MNVWDSYKLGFRIKHLEMDGETSAKHSISKKIKMGVCTGSISKVRGTARREPNPSLFGDWPGHSSETRVDHEAETKIALDPLMGLHLELFPDNFDGIACMTSIAESLPIKSNTIDYVVLGNCLDHFSNPQKGLTEVLRVMSPDGICFIGLETFNLFWKLERRLRDKTHEYRWTVKDQKKFLQSCGAVILDYRLNPPEIKEYFAKYFITDWKSRLNVLLGRIQTSWIFIAKK